MRMRRGYARYGCESSAARLPANVTFAPRSCHSHYVQLDQRRYSDLTQFVAAYMLSGRLFPMQAGEESLAYLREMAKKCRLLAGQFDERTAASLRKLAEEYEDAANAAEQRNVLHCKQQPDRITT